LSISPRFKFDQLNVRAGQRDFEVKRGPGAALWRLSKPRSLRADNALLQRLFQELQTARGEPVRSATRRATIWNRTACKRRR